MKIAFITDDNPKNELLWSGTIYYISKTLEEQSDLEVVYIDNLKYKRSFLMVVIRYLYAKIIKLFGKKYLNGWTVGIAKKYGKEVDKILSKRGDIDAVFATAGCAGAMALGFIKSDCKKIYCADSTYQKLFNYYEHWYGNLCSRSLKNMYYIERKRFDACDLLIFSSDWAAESAINDYKIDAKKVKVIPYGANIEKEYSNSEIEKIVANRRLKIYENFQDDNASNMEVISQKEITTNHKRFACNLLFIGVEWKRKGGDIALEIAKELHSNGVKVRLDIVGIKDMPVDLPEYAFNHGFISKKTAEGKNKLIKLFEEAHFFVLPTQQECYGIVFAEASSLALPSITTRTGGVTTAVKDNINGMTFDLSAPAKEYADYIKNLFNNRDEYEKLCFSSFNDYKTRINWSVAGKSIVSAIREVVGGEEGINL